MKKGKKYTEKRKVLDKNIIYSPQQALNLIKENAVAKFDETIEVHFNLGIDPRHADQQIRGTLVLPHGTGKKIRLAVITTPERVKEAEEAGADYVGADELVEKIEKGWFDFDLLIASPDMMSKVGKLGRLLGAKGLMPNPKSGTVTPQIAQAVKEFKSGKIEYRNDKSGIIHLVVGKASFALDQIKENFLEIYERILKAKPAKAKGNYMKSISVSTSMGPGIFIEPQKIKWKED
jgi:large subunit ribosomal protein L1